MYKFKLGDLISKRHPQDGYMLKTGIIIISDQDSFLVKWVTYNKNFFMEKEDDIFIELNKLYLLSTQSVNRDNTGGCLYLLSAS